MLRCSSMNRKSFIASLLTVIMLSPVFVSAATIADLQAQIQALTMQIAALQAQQGAPTGPAPGAGAAFCPNLSRNLSRGSRGADVMQLQQFLISQNLLASDSTTGYFGALTESAVKQWQCEHKIVCSGSAATTGYGAVGPKTRAAIAQACSASSVTTTTTTQSSTPTVPATPTMPTTPASDSKPITTSITLTNSVVPATTYTPSPTTPIISMALPSYAKSAYLYSDMAGLFSHRTGKSYTQDGTYTGEWRWESNGNNATIRFENGYYENFEKKRDWVVQKGWGNPTQWGDAFYTIEATRVVVTLEGKQYDLTELFKGGPIPYALEAIPESTYVLYVEGKLHEAVAGVSTGNTLNFSWSVEYGKPGIVNTMWLGQKIGITQSEDFTEFRTPVQETRQAQTICLGVGYACYRKIQSGREDGVRDVQVQTVPLQNQSCTWNGQIVTNGASVTAYQSSSVPNGQQCVSQQRSCTNGVLSGTYTNATCTVAPIVMPARISLTQYPNFTNLCYAFVTGFTNGTNAISHYTDTCTEPAKSAPLLYSVSQETNGGHAGATNNSSGRTLYMNDYDYDADYGQWLKANFYPSGSDTILGMALDTANYIKTNVTGWPLQQGNMFFGLNDISTAHANVTLDKNVVIEFDMRVRGDDINNSMNPGTFSGHRIMLGTLLDWPEQNRTNRAHYFEVNFAQTPGYAVVYHDPDLPLCHDMVYDRCAYDPYGQWAENRYVSYDKVSGSSLTLATDQWAHVRIPLSYARQLGWVSPPISWADATFGGLYIGLESTGATRYWIEIKNYQVYY